MIAVTKLSQRALWLALPVSLLTLNCSSDSGGDNTGGTTATSGGAPATSGGASSGGAVTSGGTVSSGGASGGAVSSGGKTSSGGAMSGGAMSGGAMSGGAASGGSSSGGGSAKGGGGGVANGGGSAMGGGSGGGTTGAGGGTAKGGGTGAGGGTSSGTMTLTSTAYTEGMMIPDMYTCAGDNTSPPLTWTAGPSGTMSYAVSLQDLSSASMMLMHWVIWDIPASVTAIDNVPAGATPATPSGAKQRSFSTPQYQGPCPSGNMHTYRFTVYALPVATLDGVMSGTATKDIVALITAKNPLATATLSGTSSASKKP